jgi:hypothetical protein
MRSVGATVHSGSRDRSDQRVAMRAFLSTFAERYRDLKGSDDLRAVLQFQLENAQGDEDYMFMRP